MDLRIHLDSGKTIREGEKMENASRSETVKLCGKQWKLEGMEDFKDSIFRKTLEWEQA